MRKSCVPPQATSTHQYCQSHPVPKQCHPVPRSTKSVPTPFTIASCPRSLRMMLPVETSHRKIWRSPPQDANLGQRSGGSGSSGSMEPRRPWHGAAAAAPQAQQPCSCHRMPTAATGRRTHLLLSDTTATSRTSYPCPVYVLIATPRCGFHSRTVRSCGARRARARQRPVLAQRWCQSSQLFKISKQVPQKWKRVLLRCPSRRSLLPRPTLRKVQAGCHRHCAHPIAGCLPSTDRTSRTGYAGTWARTLTLPQERQ